MEEIWKDVLEFEGYYQISNLGRLRSLDRVIFYTKQNKMHSMKRKGYVLKTNVDTGGYNFVTLINAKNEKVCRIHRLVAFHFLENPNNYKIVNHKDSNKKNNSVSNLEWCTEEHNRLHARNIFNDSVYGESCKKSKLTEDQVREIRANGRMSKSCEEIGQMYNVSEDTIRRILKGTSWRHIL